MRAFSQSTQVGASARRRRRWTPHRARRRVARRRRHDDGRNERASGDDGDEKWGRDTLRRKSRIPRLNCPGVPRIRRAARARASNGGPGLIKVATKRHVRAHTASARALESQRARYFAATRRSRGSPIGPNGASSTRGAPTALGTSPHRACALSASIVDDAHRARARPRRARRRCREISGKRLFVSPGALFWEFR